MGLGRDRRVDKPFARNPQQSTKLSQQWLLAVAVLITLWGALDPKARLRP